MSTPETTRVYLTVRTTADGGGDRRFYADVDAALLPAAGTDVIVSPAAALRSRVQFVTLSPTRDPVVTLTLRDLVLSDRAGYERVAADVAAAGWKEVTGGRPA